MRHTTDAPLRHLVGPARLAARLVRPTIIALLAGALAACGRSRAETSPTTAERPAREEAVAPARDDAPRATSTRVETARRSFAESPATLRADLSSRQLAVVQEGDVVRTYRVAVGKAAHPTPRGSFRVRRIVWNPSWHPPDEKWARNKTPKGPGEKGNPMKVVKIFFQEPDYYIHGTGDVESLGTAASHGCLRMEPSEAAELAQMVMESGGSSFGWDTIRRWLRLGSTRAVTLKRPVTLQISG